MFYQKFINGINFVFFGNPEAPADSYSDGLCKICYRARCADLIRRRQLKEGYSACFAKGYEDCTEEACSFFGSCLEKEVNKWKENILSGSNENKPCD